MIHVCRVKTDDNLKAICAQMQPDNWAADNEMTAYEPERLKAFLEAGSYLVLAYKGERIAGAAIAHKLVHPAGDGDSLYVHELDTHPDYRRQGVATMLMEEIFKIAKEQDMPEVWLATETDNNAANSLYKKLKPSEVQTSITYTYNTASSTRI